jgi:DNA mismatch repair protein MutL
MDIIKLLPEHVISQIAAGEVVERPASVVKELVENALDAGATEIRVELEDGGKKRISVIDNGHGMSSGDAVRALQRHATSKISSIDDLFATSSLGFRGEALAATAAVARLVLTTRRMEDETATRVNACGGAAPEVTSVNAMHGTTVTVTELFSEVPARRNFLKSSSAEAAATLELMQALSLARPRVKFTLIHNGKEQLTALPWTGGDEFEAALRLRAAAVFGEETALSLIFVEKKSAWAHVRALVSPPGIERSSGRDMFLFVNGRHVRDKVVRFGVLRGYHSHLLRGKFPVVALHLEMDPGLVDINVHPAKTEVRFQYASELQGTIALAIREGLRRADWASSSSADATGHTADPSAEHFTPPPYTGLATSTIASPWTVKEGVQDRPVIMKSPKGVDFGARSSWDMPRKFSPPSPAASLFNEFDSVSATSVSATSVAATSVAQSSGVFRDSSLAQTAAAETREVVPWAELQWVGEFARCYQMFSCGDRLLVLDQHAFHERIIYERIVKDTSLLARVQPLLVPETVELSAVECETLVSRAADLKRCGFTLSFPAATTVEVTAVPALLASRDIVSVLTHLAHPDGSHAEDGVAGLAHDILSTIACHAAVRSGESLGEPERKQLLREAAEVDFYHNCPHGRRVFRWWSLGEVARWFDR